MTEYEQRLLTRDEWLGNILHRSAYRLENHPAPLAVAELEELLGSLEPGAFVFARADCADLASAHALESVRFHLVDTNVILEKPRDSERDRQTFEVRFARPDDEGGVVRVARGGFSLTRFHQDPRLTHAANTIKAEWARNYFRGRRGDHMVVALDAGEIVGFNLLLLGADTTLTIDLIAVDGQYRRRGIGAAMIRFAEAELRSAKTLRVGTQIANTASLRLYESLGFRVARSQYVFHHHVPCR
jgi:ribosomal protein S18 acetylase RimI-like enzyme